MFIIVCTCLSLQRKIKAADLVERIHTEVDVYEKDYFALYFIENNQKVRAMYVTCYLHKYMNYTYKIYFKIDISRCYACNMLLTQIHELYIHTHIQNLF